MGEITRKYHFRLYDSWIEQHKSDFKMECAQVVANIIARIVPDARVFVTSHNTLVVQMAGGDIQDVLACLFATFDEDIGKLQKVELCDSTSDKPLKYKNGKLKNKILVSGEPYDPNLDFDFESDDDLDFDLVFEQQIAEQQAKQDKESPKSCAYSGEPKSEDEFTAENTRLIHALFENLGVDFSEEEDDDNIFSGSSDDNTYLADITKETQKFATFLSERIKGQPHAVESFSKAMQTMFIHDRTRKNKPRAVLFLLGPSGVGKTYMAKSASEYFNLPTKIFDMSGYSGPADVASFSGMQHSYGGKKGEVTSFVEEHPKCMLIFDEIEKAHPLVLKQFLSILDEGHLKDVNTGKNISFEQAIIIFTSNAGKNLYAEGGSLSSVSEKAILRALRTDINDNTELPYFTPEFLSRIAMGTLIMFNYLQPYALCLILEKQAKQTCEPYLATGSLKSLEIDKDVYSALIYTQGGHADARTLTATMPKLLDGEIADIYARLHDSEVRKIEHIKFTVDCTRSKQEAAKLFANTNTSSFLIFAPQKTIGYFPAESDKFNYKCTTDLSEAKVMLRKCKIFGVLIDVTTNTREQGYNPKDLEDLDSDGVELFKYVRQFFPDMPVYVLNTPEIQGNDSTFATFTRLGAYGYIAVGSGESTTEQLTRRLMRIANNCKMIVNSNELARNCKALTYNCAQVLSDDGKYLEIKLAGLALQTNMDSEDSGYFVSQDMRPNVKFDDVIGQEDAKKTLKEFLKYLVDPKEYLAKGVRAPRGVLFYGAPGTGKTLLAKALAGESNVSFIQKNATEFMQKYVGDGPKEIRNIFALARKYAPAIIFVDEIDAVGEMRNEENHTTDLTNTFLSEMDGFIRDESKPVIVIGATNYSIDGGSLNSLDPAFVRRFDRKIRLELPNTNEREQFLKYYLEKHGINTISNQAINSLAKRTIGKSPADLEMIVELAVRNADNQPLSDEILLNALDAADYGNAKEWNADAVLQTTRHEIGHTIISCLTNQIPSFVTNISRGSFGGYMLPNVDDSKMGYTRQELLDDICVSLGGRAAEIVYYGNELGITTGPSSDLANATDVAKRMLYRYGMLNGLVSIDIDRHPELIDYKLINDILSTQLDRAIKMINSNKDLFEALVKQLLQKNSLTESEIKEIFEKYKQN